MIDANRVGVSSAYDSDNNIIGFDAFRSNPIYGNSNTVQPKSITDLPIITAF